MYYFVIKEKYCQTCTCPVWFYFTWLVCAYFCNEIEKCCLWKSLKYLSILRPMKNYGKMSDFVSFPLFEFTLVIKLRNFWFWKSLQYFNIFYKKDIVSDLSMYHVKMSDFVSFPLLGFTLVTKLRNFESNWNIFKKDINLDLNMPWQTVSDFV